MWLRNSATLVALVIVALAAAPPPQAASLQLTNIRATYGFVGPTRPNLDYLPGDTMWLTFDIAGLAEKASKVHFETLVVINDAQGKEVVKKNVENKIDNVLGAKRLPHAVVLPFGLPDPPGQYTLEVTITDLVGKGNASFKRNFQLLKPEFGLIQFQLTLDVGANVRVPSIAVVGQTFYAHMTAVGFALNPADGGSVTVEMALQDADGKQLSVKKGEFKKLDGTPLPLWFELPMTRAGQYRIIVKATDHVGKKTAALTIPFTVIDAPK